MSVGQLSGIFTLISPVKMRLIEEYYERRCKSCGGNSAAATKEIVKKISLPAMGSAAQSAKSVATLVGDFPYKNVVCSTPEPTHSWSPVVSSLFFSRLALQRASQPSHPALPIPRVELVNLQSLYPPVVYRESQREVWDGSTIVELNQDPSFSPDEDASLCLQHMRDTDMFFQGAFSTIPVEKLQTRNLMRTDIHDPHAFNNVFWSTEGGVCIGDYDPEIFSSFAADSDVVVHAFAHAVIFRSSNLVYQEQSGAILESLANIFAVMADHYKHRVRAGDAHASWDLYKIIRNAQAGNSWCSLSHPGDGFRNHPVLGNDDQVGHMRDYLSERVTFPFDWGGIHKYSGIPNHAFYLAATKYGDVTYGKIGQSWHLASKRTSSDADFSCFAKETIKSAKDLGFGEKVCAIIAQSWMDVGVDLQGPREMVVVGKTRPAPQSHCW